MSVDDPVEIVGEMALRRRGPAGGPVIVYLHGLGESAGCFRGLLDEGRLADFRQLAPDWVGYGASARPEEPPDFAAHARHLQGLLDALAVDRKIILVGHSMGGVIGCYFCELCPERVAGFVNVEGNLSEADCKFSGKIAAYSRADFLDHGWPQMIAHVLDLASQANPREAEILADYAASMAVCDPRVLHHNAAELVRESAKEDLAARQAATRLPQIYVYGSRSTGPHSLELARHAGIELHQIADAGHWPYSEQPEAFLNVFSKFCREPSA